MDLKSSPLLIYCLLIITLVHCQDKSDKNKGVLTWGQRLQIAIDSAQALEYLHKGCKPPIIHRDIKTDNILLTENMQAKVADFGLSRIFPQVQGETHVSTAVVGTFGYLDPEYYITGRLTEKSDVYSFDKNKGVLTWGQRLQIAIDSAQALEYLHKGCKPPIIHRDIKTDNILLTENMQAKVADFGLSRIFPQVQGETHVSTAVVGTFGYLDPEYYITGRLTEKSDVYSFGIVLLELITGQPAIIKSEEENTHIVQWVMPMLERGDLSTIVDRRLQGDYDNNSVWKALETAIACVPSSPIQRPTMSQVLGDLKECQDIYLETTGNTRETGNASFDVTSRAGIDYLDSFDLESSQNILLGIEQGRR